MNDERGPTPDAAPTSPQRLGVMLGDRLCIKCGFNLHGQPISREPHYNMLSVRCPECFTVASLQEYPVMGPWAARLGALMALAWLGVMLLAAFLTGLSMYGSAEGVASVAARPAARLIGKAFAAYRLDNLEPTSNTTLYSADLSWAVDNRDAANNYIDPTWLAAQDPAAVGGTIARAWLSVRTLAVLIPIGIGAFAWGVVWSVLLLHRKLRGRVIATSIVFALTAASLVIPHWQSLVASGYGNWEQYSWGWGVPATQIAAGRFGLASAIVGLVAAFGAFTLGHAVGRPIVRAVVRLLIPPRLRGPLAVLWHADGLPSPPTRSDAWLRG